MLFSYYVSLRTAEGFSARLVSNRQPTPVDVQLTPVGRNRHHLMVGRWSVVVKVYGSVASF